MRILIVDGEPALAQALPPRLRREGHRVSVRADADGLLEAVLGEGIDLVVLEPLVAPGHHAADLCRTLRRETAAMLLVVSRVGGVTDRVRLLEAGADDYVAKPFDLDELRARVHALLRRHPLSIFGRGGALVPLTEALSLDLAGQRLVANTATGATASEQPLTDRAFRLLAHLVRHEGMVLTREALLEAVWGPGYEGSTREVDVYMRYLRQKVEPDAAKPRYLLTAWGRGYQYKRPARDPGSVSFALRAAAESAA